MIKYIELYKDLKDIMGEDVARSQVITLLLNTFKRNEISKYDLKLALGIMGLTEMPKVIKGSSFNTALMDLVGSRSTFILTGA